jgi:hypothetical protein
LCDLDLLVVRDAATQHIELEWDGGTSGELHDFRPDLPLVLRW